MTLVAALVATAVLVGVVCAAAIAVVAQRTKASYDRSSRLAPGLSTSAPTSWAGSHDPEARLHRRLAAAMAALEANQAFDHDGGLLDLRVDLEQQAVALDEQLVATAALPLRLRADPLQRITVAVEIIERAVGELAGASAADAAARLSRVLDDVRERTGLVAQARAALDELDDLDPRPQAAPPPPSSPAPGADPPAGDTGGRTSPPTPGT